MMDYLALRDVAPYLTGLVCLCFIAICIHGYYVRRLCKNLAQEKADRERLLSVLEIWVGILPKPKVESDTELKQN